MSDPSELIKRLDRLSDDLEEEVKKAEVARAKERDRCLSSIGHLPDVILRAMAQLQPGHVEILVPVLRNLEALDAQAKHNTRAAFLWAMHEEGSAGEHLS